MTATLGLLDLEAAAKEAAGNWQEFDCFSWDRSNEIEDADQFCLVYTNNRDSELAEQSNAEAIHQAMAPFLDRKPCDVFEEHHVHWAVGWCEGFAICVYRNGRITRAFRKWYDIQQRLADYPLLDEDDYYNRVFEATLANIDDAAWRLKKEYDLPSTFAFKVYHWLLDQNCSELEDNDRGGYPSELWLQQAFDALGYKRTK